MIIGYVTYVTYVWRDFGVCVIMEHIFMSQLRQYDDDLSLVNVWEHKPLSYDWYAMISFVREQRGHQLF